MKVIPINIDDHQDIINTANSMLNSLHQKDGKKSRFATFNGIGVTYGKSNIGFHDLLLKFLATKGESDYYLLTLNHQGKIESNYPFFYFNEDDNRKDIDNAFYYEIEKGVPIGQVVQGFLLFSNSQDWLIIDMTDFGLTFMCVFSKNDLINIFKIFNIENQSFSKKNEIVEYSKNEIIESLLNNNEVIYFEDFICA